MGLSNVFEASCNSFDALAGDVKCEYLDTQLNVLDMLDTYQKNVFRLDDHLPIRPRAKDVDTFLVNHPTFFQYLNKVVNHPIVYVGNVGHVYMEAIKGKGFCGSVTILFIAS